MRWQTHERYIRNTLAQKLEIPLLGKIFFACKNNTQYAEWLTNEMDVPAELLFYGDTAPADALTNMTANRNDVLLVAPGTYTGTGAAPLTWSKDVTHMIGLQKMAPAEYGGSTITICTTSESGIQAMDLSGDRCQIEGIAFENLGENAACKAALKETGHQNYVKNCMIMGMIRSEQSQNADCCSLWIGTATLAAGVSSKYEGCDIGGAGGATRTVANGQILFGLTGSVAAGSGMTFTKCRISGRAENVDPCMVKIVAAYCIDKMLLFDDCMFYNFRESHDSTMSAYVVRDGCNTTHDIVMKNSGQHGHTAWTNENTHCFNCSPDAADGGGEAVACDES